MIKYVLNKFSCKSFRRHQKHPFHELRCKITAFYRINQIFFVLLQKIFVNSGSSASMALPFGHERTQRNAMTRLMKSKRTSSKLKNYLRALPSMGLAFVVLGVIVFAVSFLLNIKNNILLFAGLFFVVAGTAGYVYSLRR